MPPRRPRPEADPDAHQDPISGYRYPDARRRNIPPAGLAAQGQVREVPRHTYAYNPHLPPVVRFDATGQSHAPPELLQSARAGAERRRGAPGRRASPLHSRGAAKANLSCQRGSCHAGIPAVWWYAIVRCARER